MKNKKLLYIGLGVVALVGLYFIFKPKGDTTPVDPNLGKSNPPSGGDMGGDMGGTTSGGDTGGSMTPPSPIVSTSPDISRRKNSRNCKNEARKMYRGVSPRKKRREMKSKYIQECIAGGGYDDGSSIDD